MADRKGKKGYEAAYDASLARLDAARVVESAALSVAWSEPDDHRFVKLCPRCGKAAAVRSPSMPRTVLTRLGKITFRRHQRVCGSCGHSFFARDHELGLEDETMTDDAKALALDMAVNSPFGQAAQRLHFHHPQLVRSESALQDLFVDETAPRADPDLPPPPPPLRLGAAKSVVVVQNDASMVRRTDGWHEAKLIAFGAHGSLERSYLVDTKSQERLEAQVRAAPNFEALNRRTVLWIADGAAVNWAMQERLCPDAKPLVDFYHIRLHLYDAAKAIFGDTDPCVEVWVSRATHLLLESQIVHLEKELIACEALVRTGWERREVALDALRKLQKYIETNERRLDYRTFRQQGWPIGSGLIESAHKWVLQTRLKGAGMRWSPENAQRMAHARALYATVGPKDFYAQLAA